MTDRTFFPQEITIEDIDTSFVNWLKEDNKFNQSDDAIPILWMETERYGEFKKTWYLTDDNGEVMIPAIIVSRMPGNIGHWDYANIPNRQFTHRLNVRRTHQGIEFDKYSIREPTHVKAIYEVRFQSYKMFQQNQFIENILHTFASKFAYVNINDQWCSMQLDGGMSDESQFDDALSEKFFQTVATIAVNAHLITKKHFKEEQLAWRFSIGEAGYDDIGRILRDITPIEADVVLCNMIVQNLVAKGIVSSNVLSIITKGYITSL